MRNRRRGDHCHDGVGKNDTASNLEHGHCLPDHVDQLSVSVPRPSTTMRTAAAREPAWGLTSISRRFSSVRSTSSLGKAERLGRAGPSLRRGSSCRHGCESEGQYYQCDQCDTRGHDQQLATVFSPRPEAKSALIATLPKIRSGRALHVQRTHNRLRRLTARLMTVAIAT